MLENVWWVGQTHPKIAGQVNDVCTICFDVTVGWAVVKEPQGE